MKEVSVVFFIQNFEVKRFDDCAGYREVVKPMLASGLVKDHRICFHERSHEHIMPLLKTRLADYAERCREKRVVLYGAGIHTHSLLSEFSELNVVAISDREPALHGQTKWGYPIISPQDIAAHADVVLISSRAFETAILSDLSALSLQGVEILPLYQGLFDRAQWHQGIADSLNDCMSEFSADILFFLPSHPEENLPGEYFHQIRQRFPDLKIVTLWWDYDEQSASSTYLAFERDSLAYSDLVIENTNVTRLDAMRNRAGVYQHHTGAEKVHFLPTTADPELFYPRNNPKKYDVAIFGSSAGKRKEWIEFLYKVLGERFHHIGGVSHGDETLAMEDYALAIAQTRIVVNTQTYPFRLQCKGRVREVLACGTFLLEESNAETKVFLNESKVVDYFDSQNMLLEKIDKYLAEEALRESCARSGVQWMNEHCNSVVWTTELLSALYRPQIHKQQVYKAGLR